MTDPDDRGPEPFDLIGASVHLDGAAARAVPTGDEGPGPPPGAGWVVSVSTIGEDTRTWRRNRDADEVLYLLSGAVDVVLDDGTQERVLALTEATGLVLPRETWHREVVRTPGDVLSIACAGRTEHRPVHIA